MICGTALGAAPAFAQDTTTDQGTTVQEIVVTGSRIARPNLDSPTPVSVVDQRIIEATGEVNTGEIIRQLPSAGVSALTPTNSNFFTTDNGVTTVNLRNLGEDRTLVLVNGRRYVAGLPGTQEVDFNSIPTELVERIDVVTGGASAIYGSDALAGVINIITQKNFEGFELSGQGGQTERGDMENYRIGIKTGSNFADGRGNVVAILSYNTQGAVFARDRCDQDMCVDGLGGGYFGEDFRKTETPFYSSFTPRGVALVPRIGASNQTRVVTDTGATVPYVGSVYGYNRQAVRALSVPQTAIKFAVQLNYEINPVANFFSEFTFYKGQTKNDIEPTPLASSDIFRDPGTNAPQAPSCRNFTGAGIECRYGIPITSAVVPQSLADAVRANTPGLTDAQRVVGYQRRLVEVGNRRNEADRELARLVFGVRGDITPSMSYELSMNWGRTVSSQLSGGGILRQQFNQATNAVTLSDGTVVCADPAARAAGCEPYFVFEPGRTSQAAVDYVSVQNQFDAFVEEWVINGFVNGDVPFALPAGKPQFVFGAEYRKEESRLTPDPTLQAGLASGNIAEETRGQFNVYELFSELRIPLLRDMPFAESLDLNLAGRFSDYSTVNTTSAWAASLEYEPVSWLKFRSQYAVAVRAPNISELYSGRNQTFPTVVDPCMGLTLSGGQPAFFNNPSNAGSGIDASTIGSSAARACYSDPTLAARVARDSYFIPTQPELQGVGGFDEGNPNLDAEKGTTVTAGVLFNPKWNSWLEPLSVSIDYFNIKVDNAIQQYGRTLTLDRCYGGATPNQLDPFYCGSIVRFGTNTPNVGALQEINQKQYNIATLETEGVEAQASYNLDVGDLPYTRDNWNWGNTLFSLNIQYLDKFKTIPIPGADPSSNVGYTGYSRWKGLLDVIYSRGPLQVAMRTQYVGKSCFFAAPCKKNDYIDGAYIGPRYFTNGQVRYDITDSTRLFAGVDNVFDEYVQIGQGQGQPTGWTTQPDVYDGLGRRYYAGFRLRF